MKITDKEKVKHSVSLGSIPRGTVVELVTAEGTTLLLTGKVAKGMGDYVHVWNLETNVPLNYEINTQVSVLESELIITRG